MGTLRSYDEADQQLLHSELATIVEAIGRAHGCDAKAEIELGEPVLRNDEDLASLVSSALTAGGYTPAPALKSCGADDFSFYCERYPSLMMFAGVGDGSPDSPGLHHPSFVPSDDTVGELARIMLLSYFAIAEQLDA
jgi:amidohydrolase